MAATFATLAEAADIAALDIAAVDIAAVDIAAVNIAAAAAAAAAGDYPVGMAAAALKLILIAALVGGQETMQPFASPNANSCCSEIPGLGLACRWTNRR